jgi:DNA mismatch repair protein MutL
MTGSIRPLPEGTIGRFVSDIALPSPPVLIKELLDNSLDAGSSSVDILVTNDTIEKIEVRDNGSGIHPNDFDSLGRQSHTSKLRSLQDLALIGGSSLGFRGLALWSATKQAEVVVITRTKQDALGTVLHLREGGGIAKQNVKAVPVGTTIIASNLYDRFPVRKAIARNDSDRTIANIQELLKSYTLARPDVKLSFRVFKRPSATWSYAPGSKSNIEEAVLQVFGAEVVSKCCQFIFDGQKIVNEPGAIERDGTEDASGSNFIVDAFLPRPGTELRKPSPGAFFSVDSRPLSASKGTMKKALALFKSYFGRSFQSPTAAAHSRGYFLRVNFKCSPGSYDANVEPMKNEVLFTDEQHCLHQFTELLKVVYAKAEIQQGSISDGVIMANPDSHSCTMLGLGQNLGHLLVSNLDFLSNHSPTPCRPRAMRTRHLLGLLQPVVAV